jgi:hypothetical protein
LLLRILKGAPAPLVVEAGLEVCTQAIVVERADLCARWLFALSGALRALSLEEAPSEELRRGADLLAAAIARATPADQWAFALAELLLEISDRALEPLRITRAHIVRARLDAANERAAHPGVGPGLVPVRNC